MPPEAFFPSLMKLRTPPNHNADASVWRLLVSGKRHG